MLGKLSTRWQATLRTCQGHVKSTQTSGSGGSDGGGLPTCCRVRGVDVRSIELQYFLQYTHLAWLQQPVVCVCGHCTAKRPPRWTHLQDRQTPQPLHLGSLKFSATGIRVLGQVWLGALCNLAAGIDPVDQGQLDLFGISPQEESGK